VRESVDPSLKAPLTGETESMTRSQAAWSADEKPRHARALRSGRHPHLHASPSWSPTTTWTSPINPRDDHLQPTGPARPRIYNALGRKVPFMRNIPDIHGPD